LGASRAAVLLACGALGIAGQSAIGEASGLNRVPPARAPCSVLSGHPCHPSFCGVFHRGPCFPYYEPPLGQELRLTIVSTDADEAAHKTGADAKGSGEGAENLSADAQQATDDHGLDTIAAMFAALRGCWVPPPKNEARHGMEYTIRFAFKRDGELVAAPRMTYASHDAPAKVRDTYRGAIDAALKRCSPLHFSVGMGGAVAGRPITIRFVDERTTETNSKK